MHVMLMMLIIVDGAIIDTPMHQFALEELQLHLQLVKYVFLMNLNSFLGILWSFQSKSMLAVVTKTNK